MGLKVHSRSLAGRVASHFESLVAEGKAIQANMEAANEKRDFSRVAEIQRQITDWERRNVAFQERARKAGWVSK